MIGSFPSVRILFVHKIFVAKISYWTKCHFWNRTTAPCNFGCRYRMTVFEELPNAAVGIKTHTSWNYLLLSKCKDTFCAYILFLIHIYFQCTVLNIYCTSMLNLWAVESIYALLRVYQYPLYVITSGLACYLVYPMRSMLLKDTRHQTINDVNINTPAACLDKKRKTQTLRKGNSYSPW